MEQLTAFKSHSRRDFIERSQVILKKVKIMLSRETLVKFSWIMEAWLLARPVTTIQSQMIFLLIYKLYEKLRRKRLMLKPKITLSLDVIEAWGLWTMLESMDLKNFPYEDNIKRTIISEIDRQTK